MHDDNTEAVNSVDLSFERMAKLQAICAHGGAHRWRFVREKGACMHLLQCEKCGADWLVDTSD